MNLAMKASKSPTSAPRNTQTRHVLLLLFCILVDDLLILPQIRHETIRVTVVQRLEQLLHIFDEDGLLDDSPTPTNPAVGVQDVDKWDPSSGDDSDEFKYEPFADLYKRRFLWYYDAYMDAITKGSAEVKNGKAFPIADFEYPSNMMPGKFAYKSLTARLQHVRRTLDNETAAWAQEGLKAVDQERGIAVNLQGQFEQHSNHFKHSALPVECTLVDNNPFLWNLTFFGKAETDLYGATVNVRIHFSINFPDEQPRVIVLTPLFHHRISKSGSILCYFPERPDNIRSHIDSIMATIEDEQPAYDPRTLVNPDASAMLWGGEEKRKMYRRKLRRSVQDSMENMDEF